MHGSYSKWPALASAVIWVCFCSVATAQQEAYPILSQSGYATTFNSPEASPANNGNENQFVANATVADKDLSARVADLESTIKKMKDKEEADKKKAAGAPSVKVIGRLQYDVATFDQNAASRTTAGDMLNGEEFRRARIGVQGDMFQVIDYKLELDFAGVSSAVTQTNTNNTFNNSVFLQQTLFKDAYMTVHELPWAGNIRAGKFYECFGLETQTSDNYLTFMERSLINGGVGKIGDRKPGVMMFNWNEAENMTWWIGAFAWQCGEAPPTFPTTTVYDDAGGMSLDMRLTYLPWYDEATDGRGYMHTGISYAYRDVAELSSSAVAGTTRYSISQTPEAHLATAIVNTGNIADAQRLNTLQPEFVYTYGPFSIQSEYLWVFVDRSSNIPTTFDGGYVQASYFLTGEHRPYIKREGLIGRVIPFENFFRVRANDGCCYMGKGAWEVAYRASYLNLSNDGITGGRAVDHTFGLNWYLNPYAKVQFNAIHSETTDRGANARGIVNLFETRMAVNF
jgi:phosphate-selective porin OprO and OprP